MKSHKNSTILVCGSLLCLMLATACCMGVTPTEYYDQSYDQLKGAALSYLSSVGKSSQPYAVGIAPGLKKVYHEGGPTLSFGGMLTLSAAKGERERGEVVIVPVQAGLSLTGVELSLTGFSDGQGNYLDDVQVGPMGYVNTNSVTHSSVTFDVPDMMAYGYTGFRCDPNELQSVVLGVLVDTDAAAGVYTGQLTIAPAGLDAEVVDVAITVYDFELPYGSPIKTQFSSTKKTLMRDYRVQSCWWDPPFSDLTNITAPDWTAAAASVSDYFAVPGNNFMIIRTPGAYLNGSIVGGFSNGLDTFNSYDSGDIAAMQAYWAGMADILADQGRLDQACLYVWDEPGTVGITKVSTVCDWVHGADSRLKTLCTDNIDNVRALRTSGHVNIHVPLTSVYDASLDSPLQWVAGSEVWTYVCISPQGGVWPNLMADNTALKSRVLPWQIAEQNLAGLLYWDTQQSYWLGLHGNNWPGTDIGSMNNAGDGTLIHAPYGGTWYASLRLGNLSDGMDDYLYIRILEELMERSDPGSHNVPNTTEWQNARAAGQSALNQAATVAGSGMNTQTTDTTTLLSARDAMADAIVNLKNLLGPVTCGDAGQHYYTGDISGADGGPDCQVDLIDFAVFAAAWLQCTDPADVGCAEFMPPVYY